MLLSWRRLAFSATAFLFLSPGGQVDAQQAMEWTGTVTVERRATGSLRPEGGGPGIGFKASQTAAYSLNGDGTALWQSTFSSSTDMAGKYSIPANGSGSGFGRGGVGFNGQNWGIGVEAEDDLPIVTDYSAQDQWWLDNTFLALLKEMSAAMGKPVSSAGTHKESGRQGVPGASLPSRGDMNATSLSGSESETVPGGADSLGGPGTIPATYTYSWNLTKGPGRPHVRIYGAECGCLEPDETEKTLHFIAGASPAGGEFSEFIVTADGEAPQILSNIGGEQASLDIAGTKDTGTVTLKIRYQRNGATAESAPFTVDFCAIEKIELSDGDEHDLAFDLDAKLIVEAKTKAWRGGKEVSADLLWDVETMGSPTSLSAEPSEKKGDHVKFTYQNLPRQNSDFGEKKLSAKTSGTCECQREEIIRTFYPDVANDHPDDGTPNWFYYWKQTSAVPAEARPMLRYRATVTDPNLPGSAIARYDHATQTILISESAFGTNACLAQVDATRAPTGRKADGIDCFGETVRHELQHRTDAITWWGGPGGPYGINLLEWFLKDWDHDQVPNTVEESLADCKPGEWTNAPIDMARLLTMQDDLIERGKRTWFTCRQRPFDDVTDAEINAYTQGWTWPVGSVNSEDWSCGDLSKQWSGKKCGP